MLQNVPLISFMHVIKINRLYLIRRINVGTNSKYTVFQLQCFTASKSSHKIESCFTLAKCAISFLMVLASSHNTLSEVVDEPTTVDAKDLKLRRAYCLIPACD